MMRKIYWIFLLTGLFATSQIHAQIASFNFSAAPVSVAGWTNLHGNPAVAPVTATANGITVSSIAAANWHPYTTDSSAYNGLGAYPGTYFPANVMSNNWFQYNGTLRNMANYNSAVPQLRVTGLNPDSTYILKMTGSNTKAFVTNPTIYTVEGTTFYISQSLNAQQNTSQGIVFSGVTPDNTGTFQIFVNTNTTTDLAVICGLQVFSDSAVAGGPVVAISAPANGTVFSEGGNIAIQATASETGATITKVEFYADTAKIGEDDTAPYTFTWVDPSPGAYQLTAKATDNTGTVNTASVNIDVSSGNYYWSTTGNIGNSAGVNFLGNVDSVPLVLRTKNLDRMAITATGNVGIGTDTAKAPLDVTSTTGGVLLPRMTSAQRNAISGASLQKGLLLYNTDSSAFQYYNGSAWTSVGSGGSSSGRWLFSNGTVYDSADNIALGTSNPFGYKLAVNGTGIFVKVIAKPNNTWPDYVFKKGFVLPNLGELERYIGEHHHLPGIISEREVQQQGIDLGGQHTALLKEVEELTLYLIRENKVLTEQNARLEAQQKEIDELRAMIRANNNH